MADLDDVVAAIQKLRTSVEARPSAAHTILRIGCCLLIYSIIITFVGNIWNSKTILSARYDVATDQITIDAEPHDCDFLRAPLGVKGCSYTRQIEVIKTGTNAAGEHFVTYDDGKTWSPDPEKNAKSAVVVWWKKE